jgi:hypothetical protein
MGGTTARSRWPRHAELPGGADQPWAGLADLGRWPGRATAVIEVKVFGSMEYTFLATAPADGSFTFHTGEANAYNFRIKFVQGEAESEYAYAPASVVIVDAQMFFLPVVTR